MSSHGSLLPPLTIAAAPWGAVSGAVSGEYPREHEGRCRPAPDQRRACRQSRDHRAVAIQVRLADRRASRALARTQVPGQPRRLRRRSACRLQRWGRIAKHRDTRRRRQRNRHQRRGVTTPLPRSGSCRPAGAGDRLRPEPSVARRSVLTGRRACAASIALPPASFLGAPLPARGEQGADYVPNRYQPWVPGGPLNGPTRSAVIHPP
jgi:hypothetical protein